MFINQQVLTTAQEFRKLLIKEHMKPSILSRLETLFKLHQGSWLEWKDWVRLMNSKALTNIADGIY